MAKCACCGKGVTFGNQGVSLPSPEQPYLESQRQARKSYRGWFPEVYLRLHPLPAFG